MKIDELMAQIKGQLKESITSESSTDEVNKVVSMDKTLDSIMDEVKKLQEDYNKLKDDYIEQVKNTGFKSNSSEDNDIGLRDTKPFDSILNEELEKELKREKERI